MFLITAPFDLKSQLIPPDNIFLMIPHVCKKPHKSILPSFWYRGLWAQIKSYFRFEVKTEIFRNSKSIKDMTFAEITNHILNYLNTDEINIKREFGFPKKKSYFSLSFFIRRSTSRYADFEKPKKKKTLSATTSLVSIPNTIKLSMLNSGLLSFGRFISLFFCTKFIF